MPPKNTAAKPKSSDRVARRASAASPAKKAPAKTKRASKSAPAHFEPTTTETSPFVTTTTSPDAGSAKHRKGKSGDEKKATPVPIKLIKDLQATLTAQGEAHAAAHPASKVRKYSQEELKNILNNFWEVLKHELIHGEDHKVSLMNYMTFRLVFRDGQKFTPPRNENSLKSPEEVTKPPRWNLSVNIKDKLKTELQHEFAMTHGDIVHAFESGKSVKALAQQRGLIKVKKAKRV